MTHSDDQLDTARRATTGASSTAADGSAPPRRRRAGAGLTAMVLPELQSMASGLGISGTGRMRKSDLIAAIQAKQGGGSPAPVSASAVKRSGPDRASQQTAPQETAPQQTAPQETAPQETAPPRAARTRRASRAAGQQPPTEGPADSPRVDSAAPTADDRSEQGEGGSARPQRTRRERLRRESQDTGSPTRESQDREPRSEDDDRQGNRPRQAARHDQNGRQQADQNTQSRNDQNGRNRSDQNAPAGQGAPAAQGARNDQNGDDDDDGQGNRRGRYRERNRRGRKRGDSYGGEPDTTVSDDDVLIPVAGVLDILDNYGFVRTSGYLAGSNDVYVSMQQVKRYGLRRGDVVRGAVKQPREGERREKYNALVRLDAINEMTPDESRNRPDFSKLTPLYPQDRLRLETEPTELIGRVIDLVMPMGKGQRALIVSPPKAGKTTVMQKIANAITTNNPECHLMVVLVDERPEEVTDMQRSVKGEVIASTFDRPPTDHTTVAELSIERAKRLVELGHDVVVLLDNITRLGRAYNLAAPASGRILSGGVDSAALYPPKRFLGAARNIENGGSLTIIATALVETGSAMDTVIFEEFKGTGNAELKLDRRLSDRRIFPAIDIDPSGTRKEELLMSPEELAIVHKLRRVLHALDSQQGLELLLTKLRASKTNIEFLMQIQKTTPGQDL